MSDTDATDADLEEMLRLVKARRDKILKFDGEAEDGGRVTWYVGYYGKYGWSACRWRGDWMDDPDEEGIRDAFEVYEHAEIINGYEVPDKVNL